MSKIQQMFAKWQRFKILVTNLLKQTLVGSHVFGQPNIFTFAPPDPLSSHQFPLFTVKSRSWYKILTNTKQSLTAFCVVFQSHILEKQSLLLIMTFIISNCISNSFWWLMIHEQFMIKNLNLDKWSRTGFCWVFESPFFFLINTAPNLT